VPFSNPTILFTKEEHQDFKRACLLHSLGSDSTKDVARQILNPILKTIEVNFLNLINFDLYVDAEKDFLPLAKQISRAAEKFE
jgi:hypothetical protein